MEGLKLIHVSKRGPWQTVIDVSYIVHGVAADDLER